MKKKYAAQGDIIHVDRVGFHGIRLVLPDHNEEWEIDTDSITIKTTSMDSPIEFLRKQTLWPLLRIYWKARKGG